MATWNPFQLKSNPNSLSNTCTNIDWQLAYNGNDTGSKTIPLPLMFLFVRGENPIHTLTGCWYRFWKWVSVVCETYMIVSTCKAEVKVATNLWEKPHQSFCHRTKFSCNREARGSVSTCLNLWPSKCKYKAEKEQLHHPYGADCVDFRRHAFTIVLSNISMATQAWRAASHDQRVARCLRAKVFPISTISLISLDIFFFLSFFSSWFLSFFSLRNPHPAYPRIPVPETKRTSHIYLLIQAFVLFDVSFPSPNFFTKSSGSNL